MFSMTVMAQDEGHVSVNERTYFKFLADLGALLGRHISLGSQEESEAFHLYSDGATASEVAEELRAQGALTGELQGEPSVTPSEVMQQEFVVTVATTKAPQGSLQIPVLATNRDDAQDKAIDWMEFMGIPHGEVLKVVLKGEAA
ncbi:hypothetical protein [Pseudomonas sp. Marseille-Q7302]